MIAHLRDWLGRRAGDQWIDFAIASAIFAAALTIYTRHSGEVVAGPLLSDNNLVFDFDPLRYTRIWCESSFPKSDIEPGFLVRHPLVLAVRPLCLMWVQLGATPKFAALTLEACFVALSASLVYACGRAMAVDRLFSTLGSMLFACSSASLFLAVIPEAYGLAGIGLLLQFLVAIFWCQSLPPRFGYRVAIGLINFGITITNAALSGLCEIAFQVQRGSVWEAVRRVAIFALAIAVIGVTVGMFLSWVDVGRSPTGIEAAKNLWWDVNMRTDYRAPPQVVVGTFALSNVVAPHFSKVEIGTWANESKMLDFRAFDFGPLALAAIVPWILTICLSIYAAVRDRSLRVFWILVGAWFVFNVTLHSAWQYRGSLYLYASHAQAALMMLPFAIGRWAQFSLQRRLGAAALLLAVIVPTYLNNSERFAEMLNLLK